MVVGTMEKRLDVGMVVGYGEFVMNQLMFVGNGGWKFYSIFFIPGALCVVVLAWYGCCRGMNVIAR